MTSIRSLGLFGGSFNPVHAGHVILAQRALEALKLDAVWLVPCAGSADGKALAPAELRLAWLKKAVRGVAGLDVWDGEIKRGGVSRSVDTLRQLKALLGGHVKLTLLMGSDQVGRLPQWKHADALPKLARIAAFQRPGAHPKALKSLPVTWVEAPPLDVSSSEIRKILKAGSSRTGLLPAALEKDRTIRTYYSRA